MSGADYYEWDGGGAGEDSYEQDVREKLIELFERNRKKVFFSRQLEVRLTITFTGSRIEPSERWLRRGRLT
jgi:hypothetical protein